MIAKTSKLFFGTKIVKSINAKKDLKSLDRQEKLQFNRAIERFERQTERVQGTLTINRILQNNLILSDIKNLIVTCSYSDKKLKSATTAPEACVIVESVNTDKICSQFAEAVSKLKSRQ